EHLPNIADGTNRARFGSDSVLRPCVTGEPMRLNSATTLTRSSSNRSLLLLVSMGALALFAQACAYEHYESCSGPEECYDVCDVYCDGWGCWEECYTECYCTESIASVECYNNRDCRSDEVCVSGDCQFAGNPPPSAD